MASAIFHGIEFYDSSGILRYERYFIASAVFYGIVFHGSGGIVFHGIGSILWHRISWQRCCDLLV